MAGDVTRKPLVVGIAGSPRRGGNSDTLLDAALAAAREAGARTEMIQAGDAGVAPCTGCNLCSVDGVCVLRDGGDAFYEMLDAADALIVATPVYFASVPAALKACYDRLQPYWARTYVLDQPRPPRRPGAVLLVRGGGDPYGFDAAEATTRSALAVLGIDVLSVVRADDADAADALSSREEVLDLARAAGRAIAAAALAHDR